MHLEIHAKQPGLGMQSHVIQMNAGLPAGPRTATGRLRALLSDIIRDDATNFIRFDEVEWAWRVVDPLLKYWERTPDSIQSYPAGSWGPAQADRLFTTADRAWRNDV